VGRRAAVAAVALLAVVTLGGGCSSGKSGSPEQLCSIVGSGRFGELFQRGLDPTDTDQALAQLRAAAIDLGQLRDAAPSEVRSAVKDELAYISAVTQVLQDVSPDDPAAVVNAVNALKAQRDAAQAASATLQAYQRAHCNGTSPTS
jgi:hypothetical protein